MEGRLKFNDDRKDIKVDSNPFEAGSNFAEPFLKVNMVDFSYNFDTILKDFEANVREVYPGAASRELLEFSIQQKYNRNVSLCPRCNALFDADAAAILERERMKKELAYMEEKIRHQKELTHMEEQKIRHQRELTHMEEQIRQRQFFQRQDGQSSSVPLRDIFSPMNRSQTLGVQWIQNYQEFFNRDAQYKHNPQRGHRKFYRGYYSYPRGRGRKNRGGRNGRQIMQRKSLNNKDKGETVSKEISSLTKFEKGKAVVIASIDDKEKDINLDEKYFEEGDEEMGHD